MNITETVNMKSFCLSLLFTCFALGALAQSANVQKVSKSVFSLTTFKKDGSLLASGRGVGSLYWCR